MSAFTDQGTADAVRGIGGHTGDIVGLVPKEFKGNPRRKPPEPSADHSDVELWFGQLMPGLQPIVRALDEAIRAAIPDLDYAVKYKRAFYGVPELGWIIEIAPYDVSVNVLFLGGANFRLPPPLGDTGQTRYVKIAAEDEVRKRNIADWIEQAGRTPGWK